MKNETATKLLLYFAILLTLAVIAGVMASVKAQLNDVSTRLEKAVK